MAEPQYFATPAALRAWFKKHHAKAAELLLCYWKVDSGQPSVTWPPWRGRRDPRGQA